MTESLDGKNADKVGVGPRRSFEISQGRRLLRQIVEVLYEPIASQQILQKVVEVIAANLVVENCSVYLNRNGNVLDLATSVELNPSTFPDRGQVRVGEGLLGKVASEGIVINTDDALNHPSFFQAPGTPRSEYHTFLGIPLILKGRVVGVISIHNRASRIFSEEEIEVLHVIASVVAERYGKIVQNKRNRTENDSKANERTPAANKISRSTENRVRQKKVINKSNDYEIDYPINISWVNNKLTFSPIVFSTTKQLSSAKQKLASAQIECINDIEHITRMTNADREITTTLDKYKQEISKYEPEINAVRLDTLMDILRVQWLENIEAMPAAFKVCFDIFERTHNAFVRLQPEWAIIHAKAQSEKADPVASEQVRMLEDLLSNKSVQSLIDPNLRMIIKEEIDQTLNTLNQATLIHSYNLKAIVRKVWLVLSNAPEIVKTSSPRRSGGLTDWSIGVWENEART